MSSEKVIIVESPAKSRTIERFLGPGFRVLATYGHLRDLPKSELGVDVDKNFTPKYIIPTKSRRVVSALKQAFANADTVYLATDFDREGEAIAWHVKEAIGLGNKRSKSPSQKVYRITFHEITKQALENAIKHPRDLDLNLINAQQARFGLSIC